MSPKGGFQFLGILKCTKIKSYNNNLLALAGAAMGYSSMETVEVGSVALQGDYFSKRLMIRQKIGPDSLQPLYTASMHLSITRLLASILEISQGDVERLSNFKSLLD